MAKEPHDGRRPLEWGIRKFLWDELQDLGPEIPNTSTVKVTLDCNDAAVKSLSK